MMKFLRFAALPLCLCLTACGGGSTTIKVLLGMSSLSGTAAGGAAIVGTVEVTDSLGAVKGAPIDADGKYQIDVAGMKGPFIIKAHGTVGNSRVTYYSAAVSGDVGGTINVTPFTDLMISNLTAQMAQNCFADMAHPCVNLNEKLTPANLAKAQSDMVAKLLPVLRSLGLSESIDLLRASFAADHSGIDAALDMVKVEVDLATNLAILRNAITQVEMDRVDPGDPTTHGKPIDSTKISGIDKDAVSDAKAIADAVEGFARLFAKGLPTPDQLAASGLIDVQNFLDSGQQFDQLAMKLSTNQKLVGFKIKNIHIEFDPANPQTKAKVFFSMYDKNDTLREKSDFVLTKTNGRWQTRGNQRLIELDILPLMQYYQDTNWFQSGLLFWVVSFDYNNRLSDAERSSKAIVTVEIRGDGIKTAVTKTATPLVMTQERYDVKYAPNYINPCSNDVTTGYCLDFSQLKPNMEFTVLLKNAAGTVLNDQGYQFKIPSTPIPVASLKTEQFQLIQSIMVDGVKDDPSLFKFNKTLTVNYTQGKGAVPTAISVSKMSNTGRNYEYVEKAITDPKATSMSFGWTEPFYQDVINHIGISIYAKDEEKRQYQTVRSFTKATTPVRDTTTYTLGADSFVREAFYILPSAAPDGYWSVDDDITIYLNSVILFQDANVQTDALAPISFQAKTGDQLRIVVSDTAGSCHYLTPLKINKAGVDTPLDGTYIRQVCDGGAPSSTPYFDKTFTLP